MTPTELAAEIGTDPKTCRKFLRSLTPERAGKGGRWTIDPADADQLVEMFADWKSGKATKFVLNAE
jgi:hypothetical protein